MRKNVKFRKFRDRIGGPSMRINPYGGKEPPAEMRRPTKKPFPFQPGQKFKIRVHEPTEFVGTGKELIRVKGAKIGKPKKEKK